MNFAIANVDCSFVVTSDKLRTTTKVRVLAGPAICAAAASDYGSIMKTPPAIGDGYRRQAPRKSDAAPAIGRCDHYFRLQLRGRECRHGRSCAQDLPRKRYSAIIDSRFRLQEFRDATSATPNQEEVEQILGKDFTAEGCDTLRDELGFEALLVTCGNKGMILAKRGASPYIIDAIGSKEPVDVTGAGDTVIAVYAFGAGFRPRFCRSRPL